MKFVVAAFGSRGDVEPCVAVARELLRRGHEVRLALTVPPDMVAVLESAGLTAAPYGPDWQAQLRDEHFVRMIQNPLGAIQEAIEYVTEVAAEKTATLMSLTDGADLLVAGITEQGLAANVAEYYGIPLAALHFFPSQILELGSPQQSVAQQAAQAQRRSLGLPEATGPSIRALEIQAYDELCLPGPAAESVKSDGRRPFVGALTLELPTTADEEVLSWIVSGTPPIYFGFGSMPITDPAGTVAAISAACAHLGERALIWSGPNDFTHVPYAQHIKVVDEVGLTAVLPRCRAIVHHGGAGTTATGLRAGIPSLVLFSGLDQPLWAAGVDQLKVGFARRFSESTAESLAADLRLICTPQYASRARSVAARMTKPSDSLARTADLLEDAASQGP